MNSFESGLLSGDVPELTDELTLKKLDPRLRLLHILISGLVFFSVQSQLLMFIYLISIAGVMIVEGIIRQATVYLMIALAIVFLIKFLPADSTVVLASVVTLASLVSRFFPFLMLASIIIKKVDVTELIAAFNKLKIPRVVVVPFAVTVRFIPTIFTEIGIICDSMAVRGIKISFTGFLKRPLRTIEYILVPLLFRSGKIAEELAASAMTRAIDYPCVKTSLNELRFRSRDYIYLIYMLATGAGVVLWD